MPDFSREKPVKISHAQEGDGTMQMAMAMHNAMQEAMLPFFAAEADPRAAMGIAISAACMFAGAQWGTLLYMGEVRQQDTKRGVDLVGRNFREGIKIGLNHAKRVETEKFGAARA